MISHDNRIMFLVHNDTFKHLNMTSYNDEDIEPTDDYSYETHGPRDDQLDQEFASLRDAVSEIRTEERDMIQTVVDDDEHDHDVHDDDRDHDYDNGKSFPSSFRSSFHGCCQICSEYTVRPVGWQWFSRRMATCTKCGTLYVRKGMGRLTPFDEHRVEEERLNIEATNDSKPLLRNKFGFPYEAPAENPSWWQRMDYKKFVQCPVCHQKTLDEEGYKEKEGILIGCDTCHAGLIEEHKSIWDTTPPVVALFRPGNEEIAKAYNRNANADLLSDTPKPLEPASSKRKIRREIYHSKKASKYAEKTAITGGAATALLLSPLAGGAIAGAGIYKQNERSKAEREERLKELEGTVEEVENWMMFEPIILGSGTLYKNKSRETFAVEVKSTS